MEHIVDNKQWNKIFNLMLDHSVSEVEVNAPDGVFIKQNGKRIHREDIFFFSEEDYANSIPEAVVPLVSGVNGDDYDSHGSIFEGRLMFERQGVQVQARCHIMLPPVCDYPQITLAKRSKTLNTLDSLASMGSMSTEMLHFLEMCADANLTVVFSGQSGAGKDLSDTTPIATQGGMKPLKDVLIGDFVYNEKGELVEVTNKYEPAKDRKYLVHFSNGDVIKAGEGHMWRALDLNDSKVKESLYAIRLPLSPKNVSQLEVMTLGEDDYISIDDFLKAIEYTTTVEANGLSDKVKDPIVERLKPLSHRAGDLFAMTTRSLLDANKSDFVSNPEMYSKVENRLRKWDREEISFAELYDVCESEEIYNRLAPADDILDKRVVSQREAAHTLLDIHNRNTELRQIQDNNNKKKAHAFFRNMTTQEMYERMYGSGAQSHASNPHDIKGEDNSDSTTQTFYNALDNTSTAIKSRLSNIEQAVSRAFDRSVFGKNVQDDDDKELVDVSAVDNVDNVTFAVERVSQPVQFDSPAELPVHPYIVGLWLGSTNGNDGRVITEGPQEDIEEIKARIVSLGIPAKKIKMVFKNTQDRVDYYSLRMSGFKNFVRSHMPKKSSGSYEKRIPALYLHTNSDNRNELVAGFIDGGGSITDNGKGACHFVSTGYDLVSDVRSLVSSLGLRTSPIRTTERTTKKDDEVIKLSDGYHIQFFYNHNNFGLNRHIEAMQERMANIEKLGGHVEHSKVYITKIEPYTPDENEKFYCLEVNTPSHLFLCGNTFIPTHNTTMLEALTKHIPDHYRIGVAEDTPELNLIQPNVTYLHSVPWAPGMDEKDVATLQWVVSQFQRNRCDKLIIGETRGKEFGDFLIAANSGMEGSMTTIHANDPSQCLTKMTNFAMKAADKQPIRAINNDIASAVDIIVQLVVINGKHRMSHIAEVIPTLGNTEEAKITIADLYKWNRLEDTFYKEGQMSDHLRDILDDRGVNYGEFLSSTIGENVKHHNYNNGEQSIFSRNRRPMAGLDDSAPRRSIDSSGLREEDEQEKTAAPSNPMRRRGLPIPKRRTI